MSGNKIIRWLSLGIVASGLVWASGCSKTTQGVKRYLGMKTSPTGEFQRKYPQSAGEKQPYGGLSPLRTQETQQALQYGSVEAQATAQEEAYAANIKGATQKIADRITEAFPTTEGFVVEVREGSVYLSLGAKIGIKEGAILDLIRKGRSFKHPLTGQVLGTFEDSIGVLKVTEVKEEYSVAETISLRKDVQAQAGDVARITAARIKLAALPFYAQEEVGLSAETMTSELLRSLKNKDRFDLYDMDTLKVWMLENGLKPESLSDEAAVKKLMENIPSDWYLINSIKKLDKATVLESRLVSPYYKEPMAVAKALMEQGKQTTQAYVPLQPQIAARTTAPQVVAQPPLIGTTALKPLPTARRATYKGQYWTSQKFNFEIIGMDIGDVDDDKKNELVVATDNTVEVFKWDGTNFQNIHSYKRKGDNFFIAVDLADINGNGRAEIYVTNLVKEQIRSFVLEIEKKKLKVLKDNLPQYLRVVDLPGQEPILLSQAVYPSSQDQVILGRVERHGWEGKKLKKLSSDGALKSIPSKFNVYSIALGDLNGDGVEDAISLSDSGKIGLFDRKGEMLSESSDTYGGKIIRLRGDDALFRGYSAGLNEEIIKKMSPVNMRMVLRDLDADGIPELLVPKNIHTLGGPLRGIGGYGNSYLVSLRWNGVTLVEDWQTAQTGGYITDIAMGDVDNDGEDEFVAAVAFKTGFLSKGRDSAIYVFEFVRQ